MSIVICTSSAARGKPRLNKVISIVLLGLWGVECLRLVTGILRLGNVGDLPKTIFVVSRFNKHRTSDLPVPVAYVALQTFPHDQINKFYKQWVSRVLLVVEYT